MSQTQVILVVLGNGLIAGLCLWLILRVWRLRHTLTDLADQLEQWSSVTAATLSQTDHRLQQERLKAQLWQQDYATLKLQYRQTRQLLALIRLAQALMAYRIPLLTKSPERMRR